MKPITRIKLLLWMEGFIGLSFQMIIIRQLAPFVGNDIIVTSSVIGIFLWFLAKGYRKGGNVTEQPGRALMRNFSIAAFLIVITSNYLFIAVIFDLFSLANITLYVPLYVYLFIAVAPTVYLLGQTIPLVTHYFESNNVAQVSGDSLSYSTIGSFLGAIITAAILFQYIGVAATVFFVALVLILLPYLLCAVTPSLKGHSATVAIFLFIAAPISFEVQQSIFIEANAYSNVRVTTASEPKPGKVFEVNGVSSSIVYDDGTISPIHQAMRDYITGHYQLRDKRILVLGAGGFALTAQEDKNNHYDYVDIDPSLKSIAEKHYIESINANFIASDARHYLLSNESTYDAIILDAFGSRFSIPYHLVTTEFFADIKHNLAANGILLINIIADPDFENNYTRNLDATIRGAFPFCHSIPQNPGKSLNNTLYVCINRAESASIYTDDLSSAPLDHATINKTAY